MVAKYPATLSLAIGGAIIYLSVGVTHGLAGRAMARHRRRQVLW